MDWTRSETLALAQQSCTFCFGLGLRPGRAGTSTPCNCVFRAIFRACYERFRLSVSKERYVSKASVEFSRCGPTRNTYSLKEEEYAADFCLISQRSLSLRQHRLFRWHYLLGADWKLCCAKANMDRGSFFHEIYRIEQKLGKVFRELEPYALFPLDEYFRATTQATRYDRAVCLENECALDAAAGVFSRVVRPSSTSHFDDVPDSETLANYSAPQHASFFPLKRKRKRNSNLIASAGHEASGD